MQPHLQKRVSDLLKQGEVVAGSIPSKSYWVSEKVPAQAWLSSVANLIQQVTTPNSLYRTQLTRILSDEQLTGGIPSSTIQKLFGLLQSLNAEAEAGLLGTLEYRIVASAFDEFLDHADAFHKSGKLKEAAILGSAVLEDSVKRVAAKNSVPATGLSLEPLIDALVTAEVLKPVQAKRLKTQAAVRNHAFHAEWEKLTLKDVGLLIAAVRDLISEHLE